MRLSCQSDSWHGNLESTFASAWSPVTAVGGLFLPLRKWKKIVTIKDKPTQVFFLMNENNPFSLSLSLLCKF